MHCPKCRTETNGIQRFCMNCGINLFTNKESNPSKNSDNFIMIFLIYLLASELIRFLLQTLIPNWYEPPTKYIFILFNLIYGVSLILLALAIRDQNKKTVAIVIALANILYMVYSNIKWLFDVF